MEVKVTTQKELKISFAQLSEKVAAAVNAVQLACHNVNYEYDTLPFNMFLEHFDEKKEAVHVMVIQLEKSFYTIMKEVKKTVSSATFPLKEKNTLLKIIVHESRVAQKYIEGFKEKYIAKSCYAASPQANAIPKNLKRASFDHVFNLHDLSKLSAYNVLLEQGDYTALQTKYITLYKKDKRFAAHDRYPVLLSLGNAINEIAIAWDTTLQFFAKHAECIDSIKLLHPFYSHIDYPDNHIIVYFNAVTSDRKAMTEVHKQYSDMIHGLIGQWRGQGVQGNYQLFDDGITTFHWELHAHLIGDCNWDETLIQVGLVADTQQAQLMELFHTLVFSLDHELMPVIAGQANEVRNPFQYLHQAAILGWRKLLSSLVSQPCLQPRLALMLLSGSIQQTMANVTRGLAISDANKQLLLEILQQDYVLISELLETFNQSTRKRLRVAPVKAEQRFQPMMLRQTVGCR